MLKGKVTIDLHDHRSGFTERIIEENMITNALKTLVNTVSSTGCNLATLFPIYQRALGGLMLFDGTLQESATNIHFPGAEAHIVGYASRNVCTDNPLRGSINSIESGAIANGYKTVWDFSTSQANGTIKSLALTGRFGEYISSDGSTFSSYEDVFPLLDFSMECSGQLRSNGYERLLHDDSQYIYGLNEWHGAQLKRYYPTSKLGVTDPNYRNFMGGEVSYGSNPLPSDWFWVNNSEMHSGNIQFIHPSGNNKAYVTWTEYNTEGDGKIIYIEFTFGVDGVTASEEKTITLAGCKLAGFKSRQSQGSSMKYYGSYGMDNATINNGYVYAMGNDGKTIYIQSLTNSSDKHTVQLPTGYSVYTHNYNPEVYSRPHWGNLRNGAVVGITSDGYKFIVYSDGKIVVDKTKSYGFNQDPTYNLPYQVGYIGDSLIHFQNQDMNSTGINRISSGYLGTICNLASEVTKTTETSMKVSYSLVDEDEE